MNRKRIISNEILPEVIDYYKDVKSITLVSEKFGYNMSTIYYTLRKHNVDISIDRKKAGDRIRKFEIDPDFF